MQSAYDSDQCVKHSGFGLFIAGSFPKTSDIEQFFSYWRSMRKSSDGGIDFNSASVG